MFIFSQFDFMTYFRNFFRKSFYFFCNKLLFIIKKSTNKPLIKLQISKITWK